MKSHTFKINALNAITNVVIINVFISIIMISALLIICIGGNSNNNSINNNNNNNSINNNSINNKNNNNSINNNNSNNNSIINNSNNNNNNNNNSINININNDKNNVDSGNLLSSQASDAAVGMLTELGVNHMGIYSNPTETETEIEQNFLTHNCNKFCANPKGSNSRSRSTSSNGNSNNNNNNNKNNNNNNKNNNNISNIEKTINRTPAAQINEIIKNLPTRGCCCLGSKSPTPQLGQHEQRASWSRATHSRCFGKLCCSRTNFNVGKIRESYRFADLKAALTSPQSRPYNQGHRVKRFIIFDGSGVIKFVAGPSFPVLLADKRRSVSVVYNFQAQYTPPPRPIYWWSFFNTTTFAARQARAMRWQQDASRAFIYTAIESLLESKGLPGSVCLLKAICFVSQQPLDDSNVFHALLNAILTPAATNIDSQYLDAQAAGRYGVDCTQSFKECPNHTNWLQGVKLFY